MNESRKDREKNMKNLRVDITTYSLFIVLYKGEMIYNVNRGGPTGGGGVGGVTSPQSSEIFVFFSKIHKFSCVLLEKIMVHPPKNSQHLISTPKKFTTPPPPQCWLVRATAECKA